MQVTATTQDYKWLPQFQFPPTTTLDQDKALYQNALGMGNGVETEQMGYVVTATAATPEMLGDYQKPDSDLHLICRQTAYFMEQPNRWVLGHLLNGVIEGGAGESWNLFPITKAHNSHHLHDVETYVKSAVQHMDPEKFPLTYTIRAEPDAGMGNATPLEPYGSFWCTVTNKDESETVEVR